MATVKLSRLNYNLTSNCFVKSKRNHIHPVIRYTSRKFRVRGIYIYGIWYTVYGIPYIYDVISYISMI